jgi:hypothetical protein
LASAVAVVAALCLTVVAGACGDDDDGALEVTVQAEIVEAGSAVPVSIAVTTPVLNESGLLHHNVRATWNGDDAAFLADARFTHHAANGGDLVTTGRGCGADWDEELRQVIHPCTADLQIVRLEPGDTHAYPVWIHQEVGPLALEPGTYVVEERIGYWEAPPGVTNPDFSQPDGEFRVRLTYTVR